MIFATEQLLRDFQKENPAPAYTQEGSQPWMNRRSGDNRALTDKEKLAEIEATKKKYTPEEIAYLSSMAAVGEYMAGPIIFMAKWSR